MPKVKCINCGGVYHETTKHFKPDKELNGSMLKLLEPWRSWGWCAFGDGQDGRDIDIAETTATLVGDMCCPSCDAPLAPSGKLTLVEDSKAGDFGEWDYSEGLKAQVLFMVDQRQPFAKIAEETGKPLEELKVSIPVLRTERKEERHNKIKTMLATGKTEAEMAEATEMSITGVKNMIKDIQGPKAA